MQKKIGGGYCILAPGCYAFHINIMKRLLGCLLIGMMVMNVIGEDGESTKTSKEQEKHFEEIMKEYEYKKDAKSKNMYDMWKSEVYTKDLEKRATNGDIYAQASLGKCYLLGEGVDQDIKKGIDLLRKPAESGFVVAQNNLGLALLKNELYLLERHDSTQSTNTYNIISLPYDPKKLLLCNKDKVREGVEWITKAARQEYTKAQINLAELYSTGFGVEKSEKDAMRWIRHAADNGSTEAQFLLINKGIIAYESDLKNRADHGDTTSCYDYAMILLAKQQPREARPYLEKAAEKGNIKAIKELSERNKDVFLLDDAVVLAFDADNKTSAKEALEMYKAADVKLKNIKATNPEWEKSIVDYYIKKCEDSIKSETLIIQEEQDKTKETLQQDASQAKYIKIYKIIIQGDKADIENNKDNKAKNYYIEAYQKLIKFREENPQWEPSIVKYSFRYLREKLGIPDPEK